MKPTLEVINQKLSTFREESGKELQKLLALKTLFLVFTDSGDTSEPIEKWMVNGLAYLLDQIAEKLAALLDVELRELVDLLTQLRKEGQE